MSRLLDFIGILAAVLISVSVSKIAFDASTACPLAIDDIVETPVGYARVLGVKQKGKLTRNCQVIVVSESGQLTDWTYAFLFPKAGVIK